MVSDKVGIVLLLQLGDEVHVVAAGVDVPPTPQTIEFEDVAALYGRHASKLSCTVCRLKVA